jgi:hypothetical protein
MVSSALCVQNQRSLGNPRPATETQAYDLHTAEKDD